MFEAALDTFKNRPTTSSFSLVRTECKHKLDVISLNRLGLISVQSSQLFRVLIKVENNVFTLHEVQFLTPEELIIYAKGSFSIAISIWILFERIIRTHNLSCADDLSEYLKVEEKLGSFEEDSVEDSNFSVRTLNVLRNQKITTLSILNGYSRDELLDLPNLGMNSINEIEDLLELRGFKRTIKAVVQLNSQMGVDTPLFSLNLSVRTFNGLIRTDVTSLGKLMELSLADIKDIRNLGGKSIAEIMDLQNKFRGLFNTSPVENLESESNMIEDFNWARTKLTEEITNILESNGAVLEITVHQFSLESFDYASGAIISKNMQDRTISLEGICNIVKKSLTEASDKIVIFSIINLISVMRNAIDNYLRLESECVISIEERQAFNLYEKKYANDVIDLVEFDAFTLSILGYDAKETRGFLGNRSFFELLDLLKTQLVTQELPWEIVKGIKIFFKQYGAFPNIAGLVIATAFADESRKHVMRQIFQRYLEIERPEYAERDSLIIMLRIEKKTLDQIGQIVGLTRERIRQIIRKISPTLDAAIEFLVLESEGFFSPVSEEIFRNLFHDYGAVYLSELVALLELEESKVLACTPRKFHKFIIDKFIPPVFTPQWSKDDVIAILRKAGTYYFPLKIGDYEYLLEIGEISGPSVPYIYNKYGSWTEMCVLAGVEPAPSPRGEYTVLWNDDELISFLQRYLLEEGTTGSANGYSEWRNLQNDHVPSGVLIRNQFEKWSNAKRIALEGIRISKGKTVKG